MVTVIPFQGTVHGATEKDDTARGYTLYCDKAKEDCMIITAIILT